MRASGFPEACMQILYGKSLFGKTHNGKGKVSVLRKRTCVHERKMHGLSGKSGFKEHGQGSYAFFL